MRTINFSEARSKLKEVLDTVSDDHSVTIITRRDGKDTVLMSMNDYNALQETLYLFGNAANAARLQMAIDEADASLPAGARILGPDGRVGEMGTGKTGLSAGAARYQGVRDEATTAVRAAGKSRAGKLAKAAAKAPSKPKAAAKRKGRA